MNRAIEQIAKFLSVALYPLFVPTYGVALFCWAYSLHVEPLAAAWIAVAIGGTFLLTCAIPISAIWILMRRGKVTDLQIENASERTIPYIYTVLGFCFWNYLMVSVLHAPLFISMVSIGGTVSIALVALINRSWKISAHLTGFGGLVGGLLAYCLDIGAIPTWWVLLIWFGLSLLLMYARLFLQAHTSAQVIAGWLLGIVCTFIPYGIYSYVA